ncbi:COG4 transport protein [Toxoplasma gondii VAND]|uniref:COG4 transport protein n=1 Tax=Toxoplasma gondii VAND TaxID=933077 RepID=A0A086QM71_TOXGO|nr:COG4 transport protein [Toxoplasma gondii VAND]
MASSWAPRSSACVPGACIDETLQRRGCPQRVRNADDPLLCLLQQAEAQTEAYEQGVDALLSSLLHERDSRRKQAHLEAELLADFQTQQTQLAGATRHVEKQLRRLEARASAMSAVVCHLEDEQKHLEEAKQIVEGILQLRTLKGKFLFSMCTQRYKVHTNCAPVLCLRLSSLSDGFGFPKHSLWSLFSLACTSRASLCCLSLLLPCPSLSLSRLSVGCLALWGLLPLPPTDQLAAALSEGQLLAATAAACRVQEIRAFFNQVDEKYATAAGLLSATPAARKSPALPPRLSTVEAAALQQLQEMQTRLLDLLFRTLSSACTSAARERREAREARQRGGADAESEKKKETGGATAPAGSGGGSTGSQGVPTSSGRDGELLNPQQTQKREWRRELTDVFTSLRALQLHQDALKRFVDQLRSQLADNAARRFKVLLQLQKQTAKFQASGDTRGASHPPDLHSAALQQLGADVADVLRHQVKALELAAGTPPACGRGNWNASSPGEAAAAGLFSIVALRQEIDIQSVRILNHFSELNKEILSMKAGDKQIATSLRRVDCVLSEIISLSAQCMRMHRRLKIAASRRGSSLLLQTESLPEGTAQDGDESLHAKSASGKNAGATLVEFVRQCSACSDLTFQRSLLMKGREELMAHYVSLENAFIIGSIDQALNVVDEVPLQSAWEVEQSRGSVSGFLGGSGDAQYAPWLGSSSEPEKEDEDDERLYSTVVDDVFFILNNSVLRAIGSLDVLAVCAVVNNVCSVLSSEVKMKLRKNLEESKTYYANYIRVRD